MSLKKLPAALALAIAASAATGCIIDASTAPTTPPGATGANRAPIIAAFDYNPKTGVSAGDAITFTVVANDLEGDPLQYNWSSTKGTLAGNSGQTISWRPTKADGTFEPGLTSVSVIISDGRQTSTGSVNIQIDAQGHATIQGTVLPPTSSVDTAPTSLDENPAPAPNLSSSTATPAATSAPTAEPATDSGAITGTVLFEDGFDKAEGDFNLWAPYDSYGGLKWKIVPGGAQGSANAAIANDAEDEVKASTDSYNNLAVADSIDLTNAKFPRVRFYVKNPATPGSSVTFKATWNAEGSYAKEIAPEFSGSKDWSYKDFNLATFKGKPGKLAIEVRVRGTNAKFAGPMVDNITVYDAPQR
jgi:hypothetical protein